MIANRFFILASTLLPLLALLFTGCASDPAEPPAAPAETSPAAELHAQSAASLKTSPANPEDAVPPEGIRVRELRFESEAGSRTMRLYQPAAEPERPVGAVLFLHGIDRNNARFCIELVRKANVAVAAPELRLSPEAPWPAALDDALAAYNHLCTNADELGIDPERIALAGDGAGALPAVAVARDEYETTGQKPAALLLFYPLVALEEENRGISWNRYATEFGLDAATVQAFTDSWIPDAEDRETASPFRTEANELPPTLLVVAGCDVLRDQGLGFATKLRRADVPVRVRRYSGAIHGFLTRPGLDAFFKQGVEDAASFLSALPAAGK